MKSGTLATKVIMAVIFIAVIAYLLLQAVSSVLHPMNTMLTYTYVAEETSSVDGYVFRQEEVISGNTGGILNLTRSEGERVSAGGTVAVVYQDQAALDQANQISTLQLQLEQLQYALDAEVSGDLALKLDSSIVEKIIALRKAVTQGKLSNTEDELLEVKSLVLKRDHTYEGTEEIQTLMEQTRQELNSLRAASASSTNVIRSSKSGIFSGVLDGYESVLVPDALETLTPSSFSVLIGQQGQADATAAGKLVLGDTWWFAATLSDEEAALLEVGDSVPIRFSKDLESDVSMTIQRISDSENGKRVVVFSCRSYLAQITLLRHQTADIIRASYTGLRVPASAIHADENGQVGVYCIIGLRAVFKPVSVVYQGDGYYLLKAGTNEDGTALTGQRALRAGDEVITDAKDLYDGKVVR